MIDRVHAIDSKSHPNQDQHRPRSKRRMLDAERRTSLLLLVFVLAVPLPPVRGPVRRIIHVRAVHHAIGGSCNGHSAKRERVAEGSAVSGVQA